MATLDYILFTPGNSGGPGSLGSAGPEVARGLRAVAALKTPPNSEGLNLPSEIFPSDHLLLAADFEFQ